MQNTFYPGHMKKSLEKIKEDIKAVDLVLELHDARIPILSTPDRAISNTGSKPRLIILNKADLADEKVTNEFLNYFAENGQNAIALSSNDKSMKSKVSAAITKATAAKRERDLSRGIKNSSVKVMAIGIPNVGKSTFLNSLMGRSSLKTGNKPGVTRGNQWVNSGKGLYVLDTAGILEPSYSTDEDFYRLAITGAVPLENVDPDKLLEFSLSYLKENYPGLIRERYGVEDDNAPDQIIYDFADAKNLKKQDGEPDINRAVTLMINDLKSGKFGRITWERTEK